MDCAFCFFIDYILPSNNLHISKSLIFFDHLITRYALWNKGSFCSPGLESDVTHMGDAALMLNIKQMVKNYTLILIIIWHQVRYLAGFSAFWVQKAVRLAKAARLGVGGCVNIYERLRDYQGINHVYGFRKLKVGICKEILSECSEAVKTKNMTARREKSIIILELSGAILFKYNRGWDLVEVAEI